MRTVMLLIMMTVVAGCSQEIVRFTIPAEKIPPGYPKVVRFTPERYEQFIEQWVLLAPRYDIDPSAITIDSVLMTPRSLGTGNSWNAINLFPGLKDTITIDQAKERLLQFIDEWKELFHVSSHELTLLSEWCNPYEQSYTITYHKAYPYPHMDFWTSAFRNVTAVIRTSGVLKYFSSECAPNLDIPNYVNITADQAKQIARGKEWQFYDWGGKNSLRLSNDLSEPTELEQILVPRYTRTKSSYDRLDSIEYRQCWKITTPVYYIYVDAITGEDINYAIQYVLF